TDTVPFGAYRREVFDTVGFFNEKMIRHQDYEFCYRLRQAGGEILLLPQVRAQYYVRSSLDALWRQYWQYGTWKGFFIRKHPDSLKLRHMVPPAFILALVLALISLFVVEWGFWFMVFILLLYSGFIVAAAVKMSQQAGTWRYAPLLPAILMALHLSWGAGVWWGFFTRSI
ncbi:MAG: hypothetical protein KDE28_29960, partial [Anaerolineales bacterium]|nr:hypothetical protein [Anaerolineales bacterium]